MCVVGGHFCFGNKEISLTPKIGISLSFFMHFKSSRSQNIRMKLKVMIRSIEVKKSTRLRSSNVLRTSLCAKNKLATLKGAAF
jgi:hypothetical protein